MDTILLRLYQGKIDNSGLRGRDSLGDTQTEIVCGCVGVDGGGVKRREIKMK